MTGKKAEVWDRYGRGSTSGRSEEGPVVGSNDKDCGRYVDFTVDGRDGRLTFGKHRGRLVSELVKTEDGKKYLRWVMLKTFPDDFKALITTHLERRAR